MKQEKREIQQINKDEGIVELDDDEKDKLIDLDSFTAVPLPADIIHYAVQPRASCLHSCLFVRLAIFASCASSSCYYRSDEQFLSSSPPPPSILRYFRPRVRAGRASPRTRNPLAARRRSGRLMTPMPMSRSQSAAPTSPCKATSSKSN